MLPQRAETDEKTQRSFSGSSGGRGEEREEPLHLRVEDPVELLVGLLGDLPVGQDARGVDQPGDGPHSARTRARTPPSAPASSTLTASYRASPPAAWIAARVRRISRLASTSWTRAPSSAGAGLCPWLRASARRAFFRPASSATPAQQAGSGASGVRPRRTKRARLSRAHSSMQAAVTPRAPPETTTTSPADDHRRALRDGPLHAAKREPASGRGERHLRLAAPFEQLGRERLRERFSVRGLPVRGRRPSAEACGHSWPAVFTRAGRPASHARRGSIGAVPKAAPVSCTVTKRPRSFSSRTARVRARANASRFTAIAASTSATSRRPPRETQAVAPEGRLEVGLRVHAAGAQLGGQRLVQLVRARDPDLAAAQEPGLGETGDRGLDPLQDETAQRRRGFRAGAALRRCAAAAAAGRRRRGRAATGVAAEAARPGCPRPFMYSTIAPRVRSDPMCPMSTDRSSGAWSATADRISTLLIESIPRSPSRSIPRFSMSAG